LKNENVMRAMEGFYGNDLPEQLKKIGVRALSKKDKDNVDMAYQTASRMHLKDAEPYSLEAGRLIGEGKDSEAQEALTKREAKRALASKMARERAKFSGKTEEAFKLVQEGNEFKIDINAVGDFFKKIKPKDFDEIGVDNIEKLIKEYGQGNASKENEMKKAISDSMNISALGKLVSNGEKAEETEYLINLLAKNGRKDEIEAIPNLNAALNSLSKAKSEQKTANKDDNYSAGPETSRMS